jgi:carbon-monoxide dehydrogenase medium subunit
VAAKVPLLARATPLIGHFQIRSRGTIGGSLAHADAAAEYPAVALALDAVIETLSPRGQRAIPAAEFFTGIWSTALEPDELLTGVTFRAPRGRAGFAVEEFARRPGDFAVAGTAIAIELDSGGDTGPGGAGPGGAGPGGAGPGGAGPSGAGPSGAGLRLRRCAIGLFGLGQAPLRATAAEAAVVGLPADDAGTDAFCREIGQAAMADLDSVPSDLHGPAAYRKRVGAALVARALRQAIGEALGKEATSG